MGHVGVHDDDKVAGGSLYPVDVGRSKSKLAASRLKDNLVGPIDSLKLLGNLQCSIRRPIINDYNLKVINVLATHTHISFR